MKHIVIYGGEISGVSAAIKAVEYLRANESSNELNKVSIIIPYPNSKLGGLGTVGGLNEWDVKVWENSFVQGGTFANILKRTAKTHIAQRNDIPNARKVELNEDIDNNNMITAQTYGQSYRSNPEDSSDTISDMGKYINQYLESFEKNVSGKVFKYVNIIPQMDIIGVNYSNDNDTKSIEGLYLRGIKRSDFDDNIKWDRNTKYISGDVFIDASDDGKLTSALTTVTAGRCDWPWQYLEDCEKTTYNVGRQQSATLYFRINMPNETGTENGFWYDSRVLQNYIGYEYDSNHQSGTAEIKSTDLYNFNFVSHLDSPYIIKTYNMGRNGVGNTEFWANTMLYFGVDGRAHYRDVITKYYPQAMISDNVDRDTAWKKCVDIINQDDFINALKTFNRVSSSASIVKNNAKPVVAPIMYIRESVHMPQSNHIDDRISYTDIDYAIADDETFKAGESDYDAENYSTRIGVGYYGDDVHPYTKDNFVYYDNNLNKYRTRSAKQVARPDKYANGQTYSDHPFYIPYNCIHNNKVSNLLVVGNAASVSSFSWGEMRVLPNMCVIGDAAGLFAAYCILNGDNNLNYNNSEINSIRAEMGDDIILDIPPKSNSN